MCWTFYVVVVERRVDPWSYVFEVVRDVLETCHGELDVGWHFVGRFPAP